MRGKFITIEGTEGVGKTTNIQFIQNWLESKQLAYLLHPRTRWHASGGTDSRIAVGAPRRAGL